MLKHVEKSVAVAALQWFRDNEAGLAATYAPHAELDVQFRGRLKLLRDNIGAFVLDAEVLDPDVWSADLVLGAFTAAVMLKDALDAAGPLLLRRTHQIIASAATGAGLPILDPRAVEDERRRRGGFNVPLKDYSRSAATGAGAKKRRRQ